MKNSTRSQAINTIAGHASCEKSPCSPVSVDYYGEDVFSPEAMQAYLPKGVANQLLATIHDGLPLNPDIAGDVAHAMKQWAIERGATHYTHWFQPMTGSTAEKHDSFLDPKGMHPVMTFSDKNLITSEPDASSFPSGGLRCTFEARGYTAWDPTSPAFLKRHGNGATLCIPTAYCSYTGDALDKKTPLLRSRQALTQAVKRLMKCFGMPDKRVTITLGLEQEYFLIDKNFYLNRPDLLQTGRTLFGTPPAKHQQLEDHYFGSIKPRILDFMSDVEKELWRLGVPAKTRHNEVAPAQFELAPLFEDINLAIDHNMIVMETLRQQANKHGLVCLLHEKPFAGVNGSGKHNNWSITYGNQNLLDPGTNPQENAIFITVLTAIIEAVDKHADLLRSSVATAGNDHRLGANEAPPAIISIFLGDQLNAVIESIISGGSLSKAEKELLKIGVDTLPILHKDSTDRNRTSPFAFTGNKFEFRAPGSSQSCAGPMIILNTIVAEAIDSIADELEKFGKKTFLSQLQSMLKKRIIAHRRIIYNGDNYSEEWVREAKHRGLPNLKNTPEALLTFISKKNAKLFSRYGVFSERELHSRFDIMMEEYHRRIKIEGTLSREIVSTMILPALKKEYTSTITGLAAASAIKQSRGLFALQNQADKLGKILEELICDLNSLEMALWGNNDDILPAMQELRTTVDIAEGLVCDDDWPLPKYREMLFIY